MTGEIIVHKLKSELLRGNRAKESCERLITVYLPPEHRSDSKKRFPVVYGLAPWTSAGRMLLQWQPLKISLQERVESLVSAGKMPPSVIVCPDLYTRFGGSQYIDSEYFGPHATHLVEEVVPFVEKNCPVLPGAKHRGAFGRSSGGFGAVRLALDHPGIFSAVAAHSADLGFDTMFRGDLVTFCEKLAKYHGNSSQFCKDVFSKPKLSRGDIHLLMLLGSCGFYSANPKEESGYELPIDWWSGELNKDVWQRWLDHDPLHRITKAPEGLRKLNYLYLECGTFDQYHLLYGARQFHRKLVEFGIQHDYEEFPDDHSGTDYRYDVSLPRLVQALV